MCRRCDLPGMESPALSLLVGLLAVGCGLLLALGALGLFALAEERSLVLVGTVALEVVAGLIGVGVGGRMVRDRAA